MRLRILSAVIGLPLLVLAVVVDSLAFAAVVSVAAAIGAWELYRLAEKGGARPLAGLGIVFSALLAGGLELSWRLAPRLPFLVSLPLSKAVLLPPALLLSWVALLLRQDRSPSAGSGHSQAATDWAWTMAGILYPGLLLSYWILVRMGDPQGRLVLVGLFTTFAADTGALGVGRLWGRHPLAPQISPGKTWEGAVGGWIAAVVVAGLLGTWLVPQLLTPPAAGILGALVGVVGPVGDLAESLLKRSVGAKDSGSLIPGHGGVLDRLDSLLFVGPVLYFYVSLVMGGL